MVPVTTAAAAAAAVAVYVMVPLCQVNGKAKISTPIPPTFPTNVSESQKLKKNPGYEPP